MHRDERAAAGRGADSWLRDELGEIASDQRTLAESETRRAIAAEDWRRYCAFVAQLEQLLPVLPAPPGGD